MTHIEIRVGSKSDIPKIRDAYAFLEAVNIPYEARILSAHRTPEEMIQKAKELEQDGFKAYIAAAGGSAHLPGMTASETNIPGVGIPIKTNTLQGIDSLFSMLQMPNGVPLGCAGINDARNAASLAARIAYYNSSEAIAIFTDNDIDLSLCDVFGIPYEINPAPTKYHLQLHVGRLARLSQIQPLEDQIVIASPLEDEPLPPETVANAIQGPIAWMGINRLANGITYAAQILALEDSILRDKVHQYRQDMSNEVKEDNKKLQEKGTGHYIKD